MSEQTWKEHDRELMEGDIIRIKDDHGAYHYAVCSGGGFGTNPKSNGNAIFIKWPSADLSFTMKRRERRTPCQESKEIRMFCECCGRWEKYWGIEYLEEVEA